jgi:hypothetical protein
MNRIIITEDQLKTLKKNIKENKNGSYMAKQQLFTIGTLAFKMWELMEEGEQLEDWMESKIAQTELNITSVVKSFMYNDYKENIGKDINLDDLIIGK